MNLKTVKPIELFKELLGSELTSFQMWISVGSMFLIWLLIQYAMKHIPKHRELNLTKNRNKLLNLKDLTELDWTSINEVKALYIQSVLKETFGKELTIQEFLSLSKYQNTVKVISLFLKYRRFFELSDATENIQAKPNAFDKLLGVYKQTIRYSLVALAFSIISSVFAIGTFMLFKLYGFTPNSSLLIIEFTIVSLISLVVVIRIGYIVGNTKEAHSVMKDLQLESKQVFPLQLSKSKIILLSD